jgi:hypothetical protein
MEVIDLAKILDGKTTYPTWSCGRTYPLEITCNNSNSVRVTYRRKNGGKRPVRAYPRFIELSPKLVWVLGFLKGEGLRSRGSSAYRRFTVTNTDPEPLKLVIQVLQETGLLGELPVRSLKIGRNNPKRDGEIADYWSKELGVPKSKLYFPPKPDEMKHAKFGACHVYISDVLFRLVMDAIAEHVFGLLEYSSESTSVA